MNMDIICGNKPLRLEDIPGEVEGKLTIEHLEDGQVTEEFAFSNPISTKGENHVIDCEIIPGDPGPGIMPQPLLQFKLEPLRTLTFSDGERQAVIDFGGGLVTYSGDLPVDKTAKLLFEVVFHKMKPRCETCRWWNEGEKKSLRKICSCPKMCYGYGWGKEDLEPDDVHIEDDEGWGMDPGPEFGCIHHEERS
jgi:hypothetical protein